MKFKIAICDDIPEAREQARSYFSIYLTKYGIEALIDEFCTGESLLDSEMDYDLVLLDYEFEGNCADGITIAKKLRQYRPKVFMVFLSGYPEVVYDSLEAEPFRFLLKPIDEEKFSSMLKAFLKKMMLTNDTLRVTDGKDERLVSQRDVLYIEGFGKNCILHFVDRSKDFVSSESLSFLEKIVNSEILFRCHRSYMINLAHIKGYNSKYVTMKNGEQVQISRRLYAKFKEKFSDYIAERF